MSRSAPAVLVVATLIFRAAEVSAAQPAFTFDRGRLRIAGPELTLTMQAGAVIRLANPRTKEVFAASETPWEGLTELLGAKPPPWPGPESACEMRPLPGQGAEVVYRALAGGEVRYRIEVEKGSGAILLQAAADCPPPANAESADLALVNLRPASIILGCGARYTRQDPPVINSAVRTANNLYAPPVAVIEGERSCVFVWSASLRGLNNVRLDHRAQHDHLLLTSARDELSGRAGMVRSVVWRLEACPSWLEAARRYRQAFERATGVAPLWDHPCVWVRQIHAVHTGLPGGIHGSPTAEEAEAYYRELASPIDPAKLLLFYWNGNCIVVFGDHRYLTRLGGPKKPVIDALERHGFRWMGYHPYVLLSAPKGVPARLEEARQKGWGVPEGYEFTPDYDGPPERFYDHFRPVAHGYYQGDQKLDDMTGLWVLHPGSRRTREYLVRNFGNYCRRHRMSGCYMDILGVGAHHWEFPPDAKVMDGLDGRAGETQALRDIRAAHPELAVMSECQSEWTTAHTFYTWEGASHFTLPRAHPSIKTKVNHPFRTALWGSYTWTREAGIDPAESALAGALPELTPSDDWSVARARLFAAEELWNDLPDDWPDGALACYRGKDGKRFALRRLPYGDGYVELASARRQPLGQGAGAADTPRLVRLRGQTTSPFDAPGRIQGWLGYRDEKPIGLNPQRTYPLLFQSPKPEGEFWVTKLPAGVFIEAARPGKTQSVLELGAADGTAVMGEVEIVLHRPCVAICGRDTDLTGPLPANRRISLPTSAPGGWVFAWSGPKPADAPLLSRLAESTGHTLSTGAADYRGWCFNSSIRRLDASVGGKEHPAITMGPGRYRGWAEAWTALASGARPVLKFEIAFPVDLQKKPSAVRSLCCRVLVNGGEVWREELQPLADWRLHGVDLSPYAGRTVLITLSAEKVEESEPSHLEPSVLFGRVRIDHI